MAEYKLVRFAKMPSFKNGILIEGLPGIGNVSRISVEFLIDKLKAKKLLEIYSTSFPNSVIVDDNSMVNLFKVELYQARAGNKNLLLLSGDCQPGFEKDNYDLSEFIIKLTRKYVKEIITLGGIGHQSIVINPKVHCVVNDLSLKKKLSDLGLVFDGSKTVKLIVGAAGLLLGLGALNGLKGFSLLVETLNHPQYIGVKESRELLKVIINYLGLKVSLKDLDDEVKAIESELKSELDLSKQQFRKDKHSYIG